MQSFKSIYAKEPYGDESCITTRMSYNNKAVLISIYETKGGDGDIKLNKNQLEKFILLLNNSLNPLNNAVKEEWVEIDFIKGQNGDGENMNMFVGLYKNDLLINITPTETISKKKQHGLKICLDLNQVNEFTEILIEAKNNLEKPC